MRGDIAGVLMRRTLVTTALIKGYFGDIELDICRRRLTFPAIWSCIRAGKCEQRVIEIL